MSAKEAIIKTMHLIRLGKIGAGTINGDVINLVMGMDAPKVETWKRPENELPDMGEQVLTLDEDGDYAIAEFDGDEFMNYSLNIALHPTHWRRMPAKPVEQ